MHSYLVYPPAFDEKSVGLRYCWSYIEKAFVHQCRRRTPYIVAPSTYETQVIPWKRETLKIGNMDDRYWAIWVAFCMNVHEYEWVYKCCFICASDCIQLSLTIIPDAIDILQCSTRTIVIRECYEWWWLILVCRMTCKPLRYIVQ